MRIVGAAIKIEDRVFFKPYPIGYPIIERYIKTKLELDPEDGVKGFYTSENTFVLAEEALKIVKQNGQLVGIPKNSRKLSIGDVLQIGE